MKAETEILNSLSDYYGSENFYKDPFNKCIYTDGFKKFVKECECYWLFNDSAIRIIMDDKFIHEDFIVIKIKRDVNKAVITYEDGNNNLLHKQKYEWTDFPLKEYVFYACKNEFNTYTFMLTSEY